MILIRLKKHVYICASTFYRGNINNVAKQKDIIFVHKIKFRGAKARKEMNQHEFHVVCTKQNKTIFSCSL